MSAKYTSIGEMRESSVAGDLECARAKAAQDACGAIGLFG